MRFRKSVKLCKGVRLNFSGSGVSMSLGVRGASVTLGKSGAYVNYGLPGTGLYNRVKIANGPTSKKKISSSDLDLVKYDVLIDDAGLISLFVTDLFGNEINDSLIISKIRRSNLYKEKLNSAISQKKSDINTLINSFIHIYKSSEKLVDFDDIRESYQRLLELPNPEKYFDEPYPSEDNVKNQLIAEANEKIQSLLFWKNKSKREEYVNQKLPILYQQQIENWNSRRENFIKNLQIERDIYKANLEKVLSVDIASIYSSIDEVLQNITLPADFSVNYELEKKTLYVDLDLPEIEDLPLDKVTTLASGKISIKQKNIKEQYGDYAICVCGMSYFFASLFFNTTPEIDSVAISAYTQRKNEKLDRLENQYVYSILFDRERFAKLDIKNIDPIETFYTFPHNIKINRSYKLETINIDDSLVDGDVMSFDLKNESKIHKPTVITSSVEENIVLLDYYTEEEVNVVIPSKSVLVEITDEDKTIYCLDSSDYVKLKRYLSKEGKKYVVVDKKKWKKAEEEMERRRARNKEIELTASINNEGIVAEKQGDFDRAIELYEQNVNRQSDGHHSYDRLLVLYRKRKDFDNELRIAKIATSLFPSDLKYKTRFEKLVAGENKEILPTVANIFCPQIKHGDLFENKILELPEFDFYFNDSLSNAYKINNDTLKPIWEIQSYFKKMINAAEIAESKKDYINAADIYEQIIGEKYWMPTPYERLVKIYAKAKMYHDEIRVLKYGIEHFEKLRERRLEYVKRLAVKYNAVNFLNERLNSGGKITYFSGVFELYNPFTIVERWKERLNKVDKR